MGDARNACVRAGLVCLPCRTLVAASLGTRLPGHEASCCVAGHCQLVGVHMSEQALCVPCRTLGELNIVEQVNQISGGQELTLSLTGDGFLYHMVRGQSANRMMMLCQRKHPGPRPVCSLQVIVLLAHA